VGYQIYKNRARLSAVFFTRYEKIMNIVYTQYLINNEKKQKCLQLSIWIIVNNNNDQ